MVWFDSPNGALLARLVKDDPWTHSQEGLDDCCYFCGEWRHEWESRGPSLYFHEPDCPWMEAVASLGITPTDRHVFNIYADLVRGAERDYYARKRAERKAAGLPMSTSLEAADHVLQTCYLPAMKQMLEDRPWFFFDPTVTSVESEEC